MEKPPKPEPKDDKEKDKSEEKEDKSSEEDEDKEKEDKEKQVKEAEPHGTDDVDWDSVEDSLRDAAKDIHGGVDEKHLKGIMKNLYKHKPNDTDNAVQIGIDMMRSRK